MGSDGQQNQQQQTFLQSNSASRASSLNNSSKSKNNKMREFQLYKENNANVDTRQNSTHYDGQNYIENYNNSQMIAFADQSIIMNQNNQQFMNDSIAKNNLNNPIENFRNAQNSSLLVPSQNQLVKQNQILMEQQLMSLVLYDPQRMFIGEQNARVQEILKDGKTGLSLSNMRRSRFNTSAIGNRQQAHFNQSVISSQSPHSQLPNLEISGHMQQFKNSLKPFYKQTKIIPEHMVDDQFNNKECYVLQHPRSQQQQRRKITTAAHSALSNTSHAQFRTGGMTGDTRKLEDPVIDYNSSAGNPLSSLAFLQNQNLLQNQQTNQDIMMLQRKFEDNESNIIHELYSKHFQHKNNVQKALGERLDSTIQQDRQGDMIISAIKEKQDESSKSRQVMQNYLTNPNESISMTDNVSQPNDMRGQDFDKIKYVQYVPKFLRGSNETIINKMYMGSPVHNMTIGSTDDQQNHEMFKGEIRCHTHHLHNRRCEKFKVMDVAEIQNQAFKNLKVENKQIFDERNGSRSYKASFFPSSIIPEELVDIVKETQDFQKTMLINEKMLLSRPKSNNKIKSRFFSNENKGQIVQKDIEVTSDYRNSLIQQRRQQLIQKVNLSKDFRTDNQIQNFTQEDSQILDPIHAFQQQDYLLQNNLLINSDINQLAQHQQQQNSNRNYYYPKVSILNHFNAFSHDSKYPSNQLQQAIQSWDFSQTPISNHNLKINIEKECVKYHHNHVTTQKNLILSSKTQSEDGNVNNQEDQAERHQIKLANPDNLTQNIFRPRGMISSLGSSKQLSPVAGHAPQYDQSSLQNRTQSRKTERGQRFFNFNEVNSLQDKKWQSPYIHQKKCDLIKKINLKQNELKNFEKSNKVQNAQNLNSSVNNPYNLWNRNRNKSNLQTRKRQSLQMSVIEGSLRDKNTMQQTKVNRTAGGNSGNSGTKNQKGKNLVNQPSSLMAFKLKRYQRPNTQQIHRAEKQISQKAVNTIEYGIDQNLGSMGGVTTQKDTTFQMDNKNGDHRLETDSLSMSSGNINVTVNQQQQSLKQIRKSEGNKRLIISKRSGDFFGKKQSRQQLAGNDALIGGNSSTVINQSGVISLTQE
ncbi:UNKNOWN [Stylonychia lemnae]|uniref:Uncharacterized protein n=1 Tax=Stylonychia lemnae TaxID=5949 RepID=A0A078ANI6_STYLE|nr:UNKNOWN [Stylonychia lemnae]|eukprot:CDW83900.1 UNKNOWN [Stylonychia lemnae]